jgi:hypothetical protein
MAVDPSEGQPWGTSEAADLPLQSSHPAVQPTFEAGKARDADDQVLASWLSIAPRPAGTYPFDVSDSTEARRWGEPEVDMLARLVAAAKADVAVLTEVAAVLDWDFALTRLRGSKLLTLRHGDFGEAIAQGHIQVIEQLQVPVPKLRFQVDPEQSLHGTDIVALETDGSVVKSVHLVETKLRTGVDNDVALEAHSELRDGQAVGFADVLGLVLERLAKENRSLYHSLLALLGTRGENSPFHYGVYTIFDAAAWREKVLDTLRDEANLLAPLHVRAVLIEELRALIDAATSAITPETLNGLTSADE